MSNTELEGVQDPRSSELEIDVGERLRGIRETYGLSQRALAKQTGVANGLISMIELGRTSPSVSTLKKILDGFPMSLAEFFSTDPFPRTDRVVYRADELSEIGGEAISFRQVGSNLRDRALQVMHEHWQPGADTGVDLYRHDGEEGGVVIKGKLELNVNGQHHILGPGDAYYFNSRIPHRFRNVGDDVCEIVSACTPPSF